MILYLNNNYEVTIKVTIIGRKLIHEKLDMEE